MSDPAHDDQWQVGDRFLTRIGGHEGEVLRVDTTSPGTHDVRLTLDDKTMIVRMGEAGMVKVTSCAPPVTITLGEREVSDAVLARLEQIAARLQLSGTREERVVSAISYVAGYELGVSVRIKQLEHALRDVLSATRALDDVLTAAGLHEGWDGAWQELSAARLATDVLADQERSG